MTTNIPAPAQEVEQANALSDEYVNAVIQRHGYDSPEAIIARLWQWIGLHGGEDSVTLLMYEAHKALSKLRAPVASTEVMDALNWLDDFIARCNRDDRGSCESVNVLRRALASAPVADERVRTTERRKEFIRRASYISEADRDTRAAFVDEIARAAQVSAPVAGEAQAEQFIQAAIDQAPEPLRRLGEYLSRVLDEDQWATAERMLLGACNAAPQASEAKCSCPSGDGTLRWPCPAKHPLSK